MRISISKIKQFIKKINDCLKEEDIEIIFPKEEQCTSLEEEDIYENIICKIKKFFCWIINSLKETSSTEIIFPKENFCSFEKDNKQHELKK